MGHRDAVARLALAPPGIQARVLRSLTPPQKRELDERWAAWAHDGQLPPEGEWRTWLLMAGRGFGKTRAGAEWISALARRDGSLRIALVGATVEDVRKVMVEGESGLLAAARSDERVDWASTVGTVTFGSGAQAFAYSAEAPEKLRGPQHHFAWCDELAKWPRADAAWDNLMLGLRLGTSQRALVTTTPRAIPILRRIIADSETALTRGGTADNPHLSKAFVSAVQGRYGSTRLGRQELEGELIEDVEGALWTRAMIERARVCLPEREGPGVGAAGGGRNSAPESLAPIAYPPPTPPFQGGEFFKRVVIGVDPPASAAGACGIVAAGLGGDGIFYVLGDHSVRGLGPDGWARAVAAAADAHRADRIVAEANNGGAMVESVLRNWRRTLPVRLVHASRGKAARAEPIAMLFESGQAKLAGVFRDLEDELAGLTTGGVFEGPGTSPDRADAMVWAVTELMQGRGRAEPRIRVL
jgi:phage terminase large subunit-like protein